MPCKLLPSLCYHFLSIGVLDFFECSALDAQKGDGSSALSPPNRDKGDGGDHSSSSLAVTSADNTGAAEVSESAEYAKIDYAMEAQGDLLLCPGCVELNDLRKEGGSVNHSPFVSS